MEVFSISSPSRLRRSMRLGSRSEVSRTVVMLMECRYGIASLRTDGHGEGRDALDEATLIHAVATPRMSGSCASTSSAVRLLNDG